MERQKYGGHHNALIIAGVDRRKFLIQFLFNFLTGLMMIWKEFEGENEHGCV